MGDPSREREVSDAFVTLASALATGYDVVDLLSALTRTCAQLLDVAAAGLLLADASGVLHVLAASSENARHLETFQLQRAEGPCLDCFTSGTPVSVPDLSVEAQRWPQFVAAAHLAGFESVHAVPMRLREATLGAMGLFGDTVGALNPEDLRLGQALADVASVALIQDKTAADTATVNEQLQTALTSRVIIEQAKGVLAQRGDLDMDMAFNALRRYSRDHNLRLADLAREIVTRTLAADEILNYARSHGAIVVNRPGVSGRS
jgi:transcriptional regulator with GAF, ATPase, and Fis domain